MVFFYDVLNCVGCWNYVFYFFNFECDLVDFNDFVDVCFICLNLSLIVDLLLKCSDWNVDIIGKILCCEGVFDGGY